MDLIAVAGLEQVEDVGDEVMDLDGGGIRAPTPSNVALSGQVQRSQDALKIALLTIDKLKVELAYLRRMKYGRSSEQLEHAQPELVDGEVAQPTAPALNAVGAEAGEQDKSNATSIENARRKRRSKPRPALRELPAHLPRRILMHTAQAGLHLVIDGRFSVAREPRTWPRSRKLVLTTVFGDKLPTDSRSTGGHTESRTTWIPPRTAAWWCWEPCRELREASGASYWRHRKSPERILPCRSPSTESLPPA